MARADEVCGRQRVLESESESQINEPTDGGCESEWCVAFEGCNSG